MWLVGLSEEMNIQAGFRAVFTGRRGAHVLRIAGASLYRIRLNGEFVGHGPARCGHGYYRVDEWTLPIRPGGNLLAIEAAGYNANGFAYLDQPSFIQAEVECDCQVIVATGANGFEAYHVTERLQRVQRYSFQRPFVEVYKLTSHSADWYTEANFGKAPEPIEILARRNFVERGVADPAFETRQPVAETAVGTLEPCNDPELSRGREWNGPRPGFKAFPADQDTVYPLHELQKLTSSVRLRTTQCYCPKDHMELESHRFRVLDFGTNLTGFIGLHVECDEPLDLYLAFDEVAMANGDVSLTRYHCANVVKYSLKPGAYNLETIEPYTLKFLKLIAVGGACRLSGVFLREYACAAAYHARFACSDHRLNGLFEAARQTFRQNSVDIFMDCPGRERAGWLCDSFFTARAERDLCGGSEIERNFFENYQLPEAYPGMVKGMLPMCYPSDHSDGNFIPNWAMWFVIQLAEFLDRTGDRQLVDKLKQRVYGLITYFENFLNSDGLLEKLERWVFLEWSKANEFVQDVNYPTNMLYAGMLDAAGGLYDDTALLEQARVIRETVREQSFDGEFFVDHAVRNEDGSLDVTRNRTETCQYYAFFFDVATPETHSELWKKLCVDFGPDRDVGTVYPDIHPSNAFIGFFLRLDVLSRYGKKSLILDQLYRSYVPMAEATGTLWEHKDTSASCNHGFASHVAHILYRDVLGIRLDLKSKSVDFSVPDLGLDWCEGAIPVGRDWIRAKWHREGQELSSVLSLPAGFTSVSSEQ